MVFILLSQRQEGVGHNRGHHGDAPALLFFLQFIFNLIIIILVMIRQKETNQKKPTKLHPMIAQPLHFFGSFLPTGSIRWHF